MEAGGVDKISVGKARPPQQKKMARRVKRIPTRSYSSHSTYIARSPHNRWGVPFIVAISIVMEGYSFVGEGADPVFSYKRLIGGGAYGEVHEVSSP